MMREWNSEAYHRLSQPQFEWGVKVLDRLKLHGDETVADAGCGSGKVTAELLKRLPRGRVIALDLSENMLRTAREHLRPGFREHVVFAAADLRNVPLSGVLDGVFSTAAFHWVPDHDRMFRSLFQALKPSGWLEAQCGGGPNLARLHHRAKQLMLSADFAAFFAGWTEDRHYPDAASTADRMRRAGFVEVRTWLEEAPATLPDAEVYKEFLATVTLHRHVSRISDVVLRDRFLDELARPAAADHPPYTLDYWRLNLTGRKPL
jgi:trans-aconitate 2-methyltransferase